MNAFAGRDDFVRMQLHASTKPTTLDNSESGVPADMPTRRAPTTVRPDTPTHRFPFIELLEILPIPVGMADTAGTIRFANPAMRLLLYGGGKASEIGMALAARARALSSVASEPRDAADDPADHISSAIVGCWRVHAILLPPSTDTPPGAPVLLCAEHTGITQPRLDAVRERYHLTERELQVTAHMVLGETSREIATSLGISPHTARRHIENVLAKLGTHSRVESLLLIAGESTGLAGR